MILQSLISLTDMPDSPIYLSFDVPGELVPGPPVNTKLANVQTLIKNGIFAYNLQISSHIF
jgi:hypothetical protein